MAEVILSSKFQIFIPRETRKALGIKPGNKLVIFLQGDHLVLMRKPKSYRKKITGLGRGLYPPDFLRKERESWDEGR